MASNCARNLVRRSSNTAKTFLSRAQSPPSVPAGPSKLSGLSATPPRHRSIFSSRLPLELGCGVSLMPLHSVTASALLKSMLSSDVGQWGVLSEGRWWELGSAPNNIYFHPCVSSHENNCNSIKVPDIRHLLCEEVWLAKSLQCETHFGLQALKIS
ncbi:hypothetical protein ACJIZ3_015057 [Penstemon smallii]|uniref:Protein NUCLEAR FUSION DEFECTIVE 6, chloroplastic/mitochondrial-like n=1 Tax=Penstemon smallii TaxID=265156 RepID=A0ABD3RLE4_9LAMI